MKKAIIIHQILNTTFYTLAYTLKTFAIWEFQNPFKWIISMPDYTPAQRLSILFGICIWQVLQFALIKEALKSSRKQGAEEINESLTKIDDITLKMYERNTINKENYHHWQNIKRQINWLYIEPEIGKSK